MKIKRYDSQQGISPQGSQSRSLPWEQRRAITRDNSEITKWDAVKKVADQVTNIGDQMREARNVHEYNEAIIEYDRQIKQEENRYSDPKFRKENPYKNWESIHQERLSTIRENILSNTDMSEPYKRNLKVRLQGKETNSIAKISGLSNQLEISEMSADGLNNLKEFQNRALSAAVAGNDEESLQIMAEARSMVDGLVKAGVWTPEEGVKLTQGFLNDHKSALLDNEIDQNPYEAYRTLNEPGAYGLDESERLKRKRESRDKIIAFEKEETRRIKEQKDQIKENHLEWQKTNEDNAFGLYLQGQMSLPALKQLYLDGKIRRSFYNSMENDLDPSQNKIQSDPETKAIIEIKQATGSNVENDVREAVENETLSWNDAANFLTKQITQEKKTVYDNLKLRFTTPIGFDGEKMLKAKRYFDEQIEQGNTVQVAEKNTFQWIDNGFKEMEVLHTTDIQTGNFLTGINLSDPNAIQQAQDQIILDDTLSEKERKRRYNVLEGYKNRKKSSEYKDSWR